MKAERKAEQKDLDALNLATCLTLFSVAITKYHRLNHKVCLVSCSGSQEVRDGAATSSEALPTLVDSPQSPKAIQGIKRQGRVSLFTWILIFFFLNLHLFMCVVGYYLN